MNTQERSFSRSVENRLRASFFKRTKNQLSLAFLLLGLTLLLGAVANAQSIKGTVVEKLGDNLTPVPFANVFIQGTTKGAASDFDGKYEIAIEPGTYTVIVSSMGYVSDTASVTVVAGEDYVHNVTIGQNVQMIDQFVVEAKVNRQNEAVLLMEQKNADGIEQSVGAKTLSDQGVSNVSEGVAKVAGISKVDSKRIYVRGLGDRYNNALLNGLPIASPNPDLKVIPLDIFPTDIVENLTVRKTFAPNMYGDFAGGTIDIKTKSYPDSAYLKVEFGMGFNSQATFQDFKQMESAGGAGDFFGYDTYRQLPSEIADQTNGDPSYLYKYDPESDDYPFNTGHNTTTRKALPALGWGLSGGNSKEFGADGENTIGYFVTANYSNDYSHETGKYTYYGADGQLMTDYDRERWVYSTSTSMLGAIAIDWDDRTTLKYNLVYAHNSSDNVSEYKQTFEDRDRSRQLFVRPNIYNENMIFDNQLLGSTKLDQNDRFSLDYGLSFAQATFSEPDRRELLFSNEGTIEDPEWRIESLNASDNYRMWSEAVENEYAWSTQFNANFIEMGEDYRLKTYVGYQGKYKTRDFQSRKINYNTNGGFNESSIGMDLDKPDDYWNEETAQEGIWEPKDANYSPRDYQASLMVNAGFFNAMYDLKPEKTTLGVGLRVEASQQEILYKKPGDLYSSDFRSNVIDTIAFLPAVSIKHVINDSTNLRFAYSQTMTRPNFKETAPFLYKEVFGGAEFQGNENLGNASNYNVDLKWETFPSSGELVAVSAFGKYLVDPIERVQIPSSGILFTYGNMGTAVVGGVEFEMTKNLSNLFHNESLDGWQLRFNAAGIYSQLSLGDSDNLVDDKGNTILNTNDTRPLRGASPYLINTDVAYSFKLGQTTDSKLALSYSVNGKRIYAAGTQGAGDIYEMPINSLNIIWKNTLNEKINLDFKVGNVLNPTILLEQEIRGETVTVDSYKRGIDFSFKVAYQIF